MTLTKRDMEHSKKRSAAKLRMRVTEELKSNRSSPTVLVPEVEGSIQQLVMGPGEHCQEPETREL